MKKFFIQSEEEQTAVAAEDPPVLSPEHPHAVFFFFPAPAIHQKRKQTEMQPSENDWCLTTTQTCLWSLSLTFLS